MNLAARHVALAAVVIALAAVAPLAHGQQVPRLIPFAGVVAAPAGPTDVVFSLYAEQDGHLPLWREKQTVVIAADGRYSASLGAASPDGVPLELFASGEARWLGVQVVGRGEEPRVALLSVPYAMKAADASMVAGRPLSAFVLAGEQTGTGPDGLTYVNTTLLNRALAGVGAGGASSGTPGYLGMFTTTTDLGNSVAYQTAGKVGIGTINPEAAFHASSTAAPAALFDVYSDALTALPVVYRAARGTPATPMPPQTGDILGGLAVRGWTGTTFSGGRGQVMFKAAETWTATANGTYLSMATVPIGGVGPAAERIRVAPDGRVGIGTPTPGQLLSVAGTIESTTGGFRFPDGTTQTTALSLGANTFSGTQTLSSGNLALPATISATSGVLTLDGLRFMHGYGEPGQEPNTYLGRNAGTLTSSGLGGNVGVGDSALGALSTGTKNTAVGNLSLVNTSSGSSNTAVGYMAMRLNATGNRNTAMGRNALGSGIASTDNSAFGADALPSSTGDSSSAFGASALFSATFSSYNNAFGASALYGTTGGQGNSAFGTEAMLTNTTGSNNSGFGNYALKLSNSGTHNAAFGNAALWQLTTGSRNTGVGYGAGLELTTGSYNTFIGYEAKTDAAHTNLTNATAIGANAIVAQDNSLVLGGLGASAVKVGIGTSAPDSTLHVVGNVKGARIESTSIGFRFPDGTTQATAGATFSANTFTDTQTLSSGNLALPGTTSNRSGVLTLGGEPFLHGYGATTAANTFVGQNAGSFVVTGLGGNVGIGAYALASTMGGSSNTAVGREALRALTSGYANTAVGDSSLKANQTGEDNVAVGKDALVAHVDGARNTAVGGSTLIASRHDTDNTAVGYGALRNNNGGYKNTAVGLSALSANTTGERNTATGERAMLGNTTGSYNTAVGVGSLEQNSTGMSNTAVGESALRANQTGSNGVAVGTGAGAASRGSSNTFIGHAADTDAGHASITGATAIGANATVTQSDSLVLGDTNVSVGIGTTAPNTKLQVVGDIRVGTSGTNGCLKRFDGTGIVGTCSSDARLKTNITPFEPVLARLVRLQPVRFDWRAREFPEYHFGTARSSGLVAQEVEQVFPDLVSTDERGFKMVDYTQLPYLTLAAVKELKAENEALKADNADLRARLDRLAAAVAELQKRR